MPGGYGSFYFNGRTRTAHSVSYGLEYGPLEPGQYALHKCDVRLCVNPEHLFSGTPQDNAEDMVKKMRAAGQKLDQGKVRQIVQGLRLGMSQRLLAQVFHVSRQTINDIARGYTWSHSEGAQDNAP
jgi:predicted XRE-type DNA-binding protein